MLKPSVKQMLLIGQSCGLDTVEEAYSNYLMHYDMFFLIEKYQEQLSEFNAEIISLGLTMETGDGTIFKDIPIKDAIDRIWLKK